MVIHGIFIYSLSVVFEQCSYQTFIDRGRPFLVNNLPVAILPCQFAIASGGEKLLFKISGPMVVVKVGIIIVFGFLMVLPELCNISAFPEASVSFRNVLLTIPFCFFSAVFIPGIEPNEHRLSQTGWLIGYWRRMAIRIVRIISYITLIAVILFSPSLLPFRLAMKRPFRPLNKIFSPWRWQRRLFRDKLFISPQRY